MRSWGHKFTRPKEPIEGKAKGGPQHALVIEFKIATVVQLGF